MAAGIVDLPGDFPGRLRNLREQHYWTQTELAIRAEISPRSVHEFESGRRDRAQAQTIMLLAKALEVTFADLVDGPTASPPAGEEPGAERVAVAEPGADAVDALTIEPVGDAVRIPAAAPGRRFVRIALIAGALLLMLTLAGLVVSAVRQRNIQVFESDGVVEVRDSLFGRLLWRREFGNEIRCWRRSPWDDDVLLVGLAAEGTGGGRLSALQLKSGATLWDVEPDRVPLTRAFDAAYVNSGAYHCRDLLDVDLDGDGRRELVVHFMHNKWFPSVILIVDSSGRVESQYANRGHLCNIHVADLDADGRDELVCAGTNNAPQYQGATLIILDDGHRTGAAIDPLTSPGFTAADSSLVRIVIPNWPQAALQALGTQERLVAFEARTFRRDDGSVGIQANVGHQDDDFYSVDFDAQLHPNFMSISDRLLEKFARGGVEQEAWDRAWLDGHLRFEQGRLAAALPLP